MKQILIVEDSTDCLELLKTFLASTYSLIAARDLKSAERALAADRFDLVLLDLNLPDGDGLQFCSILSTDERYDRIPVVVTSARGTTTDKIAAFTVGADDYIVKPFHPDELRARIEARLRHVEVEEDRTAMIQIGELEIDQESQRVHIRTTTEAEELALTALELRILMYLTGQRNKVVSRNDILDAVWGHNVHVYSRNVDTHVSKLRKKLGRLGPYLQSAHGKGYCFAPPEHESRQGLPVGSHTPI